MALLSIAHSGSISRDAESAVAYSRFDLEWSGLPSNIKITRCYWQWTVSREKGSTYARWYEYGQSDNKGSAGTNGTYTFDVSLVTGTSGTARVYLGSQYGKSTYSSVSFNVEYDYLQSSFTLSTTNVDAGKAITANITIQDPNASHKATWQFGARTSTTTTAKGVTANSFTIPLAWLDQIPNALSGLASCKLETINAAGTSVGSQTLYFNIQAPSTAAPTISSFAATRVNNSVPSSWGIYVQGQSGVTVKATAAGAYGSTITEYVLSGDGKTSKTATLTVNKLTGSGTLTFKATVTDSRGRTASKTLTISSVAWTNPVVNSLSAARSNADGTDNPIGTSIEVSLKGTIASVSGKNTATTTLSYRLQGASGWTKATESSAASGTWVIAANAASVTSAYEVQATLKDAFATSTVTTLVPTAQVYLDKMPGRRRLGIGGYAATDNTVYVAPDMGIHWGEKHVTPLVRNLLDNSDFAHPVNQRGQTSYTGNAYTIDRWRTYSSTAEMTVNDGNVTLVTSALLQYLDLDPNKTYTAAVRTADGKTAVISGIFASGFGNASIGVRCAVVNNYCRFLIDQSLGANGLLWAALYEGSYTADTLPEYVPKGYGAELAECKRYFQIVKNASGLIPYHSTTASRSYNVVFEQEMRIKPTVLTIGETAVEYNPGLWSETGATITIASSTTLNAIATATGTITADKATNRPFAFITYTASADL